MRSLRPILILMLLAVCPTGAQAATQVWWQAYAEAGIAHVNADGTNPTSAYTGTLPGDTMWGFVVDPARGRIYWTNQGAQKIEAADLDGSNHVVLVDTTTSGVTMNDPYGLSLDAVTGRLYWSNRGARVLSYVSVDGLVRGDLYAHTTTPEFDYASAVSVVPEQGRVYWMNDGQARVGWANLDGSGGAHLMPDFTGACAITLGRTVNVDPASGQIYFSGYHPGPTFVLARIDDAASACEVIATSSYAMEGVALNPETGQLARTNNGTDEVIVSNADGTNSSTLIGKPQTIPILDPQLPAYVLAPTPAIGQGATLATTGSGIVGATTLTCTGPAWQTGSGSMSALRGPATISIEWWRDGSLVPGASGATYAPAAAGSYSCRVVGSNIAGSDTLTSNAVVVAPAAIAPTTGGNTSPAVTPGSQTQAPSVTKAPSVTTCGGRALARRGRWRPLRLCLSLPVAGRYAISYRAAGRVVAQAAGSRVGSRRLVRSQRQVRYTAAAPTQLRLLSLLPPRRVNRRLQVVVTYLTTTGVTGTMRIPAPVA